MVVIVSAENFDAVLTRLVGAGEDPLVLGTIQHRNGEAAQVTVVGDVL